MLPYRSGVTILVDHRKFSTFPVILISAKEMKYQDHIKSVIEERFQDDYYLQKASTIKSNINETLIFRLLIYNNAESDTMF